MIGVALAALAVAISALGAVAALAGWAFAARFAAQAAQEAQEKPVSALPPITVLKPLHGAEPGLEEALASVCRQDYPEFQIIFGVQDAADPARAVAAGLAARFPALPIAIVVDPAQHGANRKISNLINMYRLARHETLVIADSDVIAAPDYLRRIAAALARPGVGLATTLYAGRPLVAGLAARLGAMQITYGFLPGALLSRAMGRQDCLGATMALRAATLARVGGLQALADHLADDNALGRKVAGLGLDVALAGTVVETGVPEATLGALFSHELRWARTIRALVPAGFAASALQYPILWAAIAFAAAPAERTALLIGLAWLARAAAARGIGAVLGVPGPQAKGGVGLAFPAPLWLLPLRELMSVAVMIASYSGRGVVWRGHRLHADGPAPLTSADPMPPVATQGVLPGMNPSEGR
ncbi:MAG: bacteriohopanetetrol glucosamine biosynthesis glycosyltransferase HpnI [Rhodospirillales bacterium]|nr:bacteriohopanetetrol glucosamine biosynthesis glycosyltransferase HpnI [Rhodospirillales bacterium]